MVKISKNERLQREESLDYSIKEGSGAAVMSGVGDSYIVPFALAINSNNLQIGFLSSFVGLFGALSQIFGSQMVYKHSRKRIIFPSILIQATLWLVMVGMGLFYIFGIWQSTLPLFLIFFYSIYAVAGNFGGPAWFSLMGDLVEDKKRGAYFSKRNKLLGAISMTISFSAALFLDFFREAGIVLVGFVILFGIASIGRYVSAYFFSKHYDPKQSITKESYFTFWQFIKKAPFNNFGKFVIYVGLVSFTANFAGPFVAVYMLEDLGYSYFWFMTVSIAGGVFSVISMPLWGKLGDVYGNRRLLKIGVFLASVSPVFWVFFTHPIFLILTAQLFGGVGWAAFNFGASNFIYDAVTPQRRAICVAYFTMINGLGVFFGAIVGGLFSQYFTFSFMNTFLIIFLLSGIFRALISVIMLPQIKEVRKIEKTHEKITLMTYMTLLTPNSVFNLFRGVRNSFEFIGGLGEHLGKKVVRKKC